MDFINGTFPENIRNDINLKTLQLDGTSYIDESLAEYFSDIVYSCELKSGSGIKISILFEYKSYPVKYPHLQLLRYILGIWELNVKQKKKLSPVIPLFSIMAKKDGIN